jgi:ribosomal-protein-alanine N-acetyltransferase
MTAPAPIATARLQLLPCPLHLLDLLAAGRETFTTATGLGVEEGYLEFPDALPFAREQLAAADPAVAGWWAPWLFVHLADRAVIGLGGFKGPPDPAVGMVELGYGIAPARRGSGYATEAARGLLEAAFRLPEIGAVCAHTLPEMNASARVLLRAGFQRVAELVDPVDGHIWRWEITRAAAGATSRPTP